MAIEKQINIDVKIKGSDKATADINRLNSKITQLNSTNKEATKGFKDSGNAILENGGAMGLLNDVTGGLAMTVKDAVEATGLFSKGTTIATAAQKLYTLVVGTTTGAMKALRIALVTSGIGAIVVALGFLISKMMDSTDATEAQKKAQDALNTSLQASLDLYKSETEALDGVTKERVLRAKIAGKSEIELSKIESEARDERYKNYINERERLLKQLDQKGLSVEATKKINDALLANQQAYNKRSQDDSIADLEKQNSTLEASRQAKLDAQKKSREDAAADREKALKEKEEFDKSVAEGLNSLQIATNEAQFRQKEIDAQNKADKDKALQEDVDRLQTGIEADQAAADKKTAITKAQEETNKNLRVSTRQNTENLLLAIFKKGSAIAKGIAIANIVREQVQSASTSISSLVAANAKAVAASPLTAGQPFVGLNTASTITGIALSAVGAGKAIKDILSDSKNPAQGMSGGGQGGGGSAPAPSFNLVKGTGSNQIAEGLATERQPVQAYVVASQVTTAQSLQRNIINNASL